MSRIFLNVETVPHDAFPGMPCPPQWAYDATLKAPPDRKQIPRNLVDPVKIEAKRVQYEEEFQAELAELASGWALRAAKLWEEGSKDALKARIVMGCVAVESADPYVLPGEEVLPFLADIATMGDVLVAYNCGFDRQMLFARALRNGFAGLATVLRRARWEDPGEVWRQLGSRWFQVPHATLNAMCEAFKVEHNPAFTGADVLRAYLADDLAAVHTHCLDRVTALRDLYWKVCA